MVVYAKAEELKNLYDNTYPDDDVEAVEFMCGEYADGWEAVAALLGDQRDALNADQKLLASEKNPIVSYALRPPKYIYTKAVGLLNCLLVLQV